MSAIDFAKYPQGLNTPTETIIAQVDQNIRRQLPQLRVYSPQQREMCILAGGPSLEDTWSEYEALRESGAATCAVNGVYRYLLERDIAPSLFCMLDAREWNVRFVEETHPATKHFIASQCHPAVFEKTPDCFIWHSPIPPPKGVRKTAWKEGRVKVYRPYYLSDKNYLLVPGGVTVVAKTVMICYWLGFRRIHMFGFDSCWMDGRNHAYPQPENEDRNIEFRFHNDDRVFNCAPWMAHQADSFFKLAVNLPENLDLQVHGDGLIAYGLRRSAEEWDKRC